MHAQIAPAEQRLAAHWPVCCARVQEVQARERVCSMHQPLTATVLLVSLMKGCSSSAISLAILSTRPCTIFSLQQHNERAGRGGQR